MIRSLQITVVLCAFAWNANGQGTIEGITSGSDPPSSPFSTNSVFFQTGGTWGWTFTPNANISVSSLGVFERVLRGKPNSFVVSVGLWTANGTLIASTDVSPLSLIAGQSRYESIQPVNLSAGQTFHLGASPSGTFTAEVVSAPGTSQCIVFGGIAQNILDFSFPTLVSGGEGSAILFPNFSYSIPEPSQCAFACIGTLILSRIARYGRGKLHRH
jgi:hypothetical protein